jgi:transposase
MDESGFMLRPCVVRTWAPRGQTPTLLAYDRRDRLSVISAITVSPVRRRVGLYFEVLRHNVRTADIVRFMRSLRRKVGRRVRFVLDGLPAHKGAQRVLEGKGYRFVRFPAYAPDLNPDEWVWRHAKYVELRNTAHSNLDSLERSVTRALLNIGARPQILRGFFRAAGLSL